MSKLNVDEPNVSKSFTRKGKLILITLTTMVFIVVTSLIVLFHSNSNSLYFPKDKDTTFYSEFDASTAVQKCITLQYGSFELIPEVVDCFRESLYLAVKSDQFDKIVDMQDTINRSGAYGSCHPGAHLAGVDLVKEKPMHELLPIIFKKTSQGKDDVCTTGLIHGLVQGSAVGEPPFDLSYLVEQCERIQLFKPEYAPECAHYFGHVTYKNFNSLNNDVATTCELLLANDSTNMTPSCVGGALMQKLSLQDATYDPEKPMDLTSISMNPPDFSETISMCTVYNSYPNELILRSCWGGIGWVLAIKSITEIEKLNNPGFEYIIAKYAQGLNYCKFDDCVWTFLQTLRMEDYVNPNARSLCTSNMVKVKTTSESFSNICDFVIASRTGSKVSTGNTIKVKGFS